MRLGLSPRLTPVAHSADTVVLLSEEGSAVLTGPIYVDLVRHLSGGVTWNQLQRRLGSRHCRQEVVTKLQELVESGLVEPPRSGTRAEAAFWESVATNADPGPLAVVDLGDGIPESITPLLRASGLRIRRDAPRALAITNDYLRPELRGAFRRWRQWLLAKPIGHTVWIGPLFGQKESACWRCLAHWLRANRWQEAAFDGEDEDGFPRRPAVAATPGTLALAAGLISTAAALWIARGDHPELLNRIITLDTRTLRVTKHIVHRRAGCPDCGGRKDVVAVPPLQDWVSPLTGIISRLEVSPVPAFGFFHARAVQVQPLPHRGARPLLRPSWALGRGRTALEAELSCLGEAIERYSTVYQGNEDMTLATAADTGGINPDRILLFSERQYRDRDSWNARHAPSHCVPERLDPRQPIRWTQVRSLLSEEKEYMPTGCCYYAYPFPDEVTYACADSNGCASGRTLEQAIFGGLMELIERDAVAIWWYNRLSVPAVELASFDEPFLLSVRDELASDGRDLFLLDVTSDLGTPVYVAVAPRHDGSQPYLASAAHPNPVTAAVRATGELAQALSLGAGLSLSPERERWLATATLKEQAYLNPQCVVPLLGPGRSAGTEEEEVRRCAQRIQAAGIEAFYADLTRADVSVPVVRVVAPGLRSLWPRFGPGRLYDVPCRMGWRGRPNREEDLNPIPCVI